MSDFTTALERELQRLEFELRRDPKFRRADQIRTLLAEYRNGTGEIAAPTVHYEVPKSPVRLKRARLSKAASVRLAVQQLLQEKGPTHRSAILKYMIDQKLMGHETNPLAQLAAYLSHWKDLFEADGRGNFSLKKSTEKDGGKHAPVSH